MWCESQRNENCPAGVRQSKEEQHKKNRNKLFTKILISQFDPLNQHEITKFHCLSLGIVYLKWSLSLFICSEYFTAFFLIFSSRLLNWSNLKQFAAHNWFHWMYVFFVFGRFQSIIIIRQFCFKPHNLNNKYWFSTRIFCFTHLSVTQA